MDDLLKYSTNLEKLSYETYLQHKEKSNLKALGANSEYLQMMMNLKNNEIIDLNEAKRQTNLINTIRKYDDRTVSYNRAK